MANLTVEQLIQKIHDFKLGCHEAIVDAMEKAALNDEGLAKKYCTPGHSPYDWEIFPTKLAEATRKGREYSGAPYSLKSAVLHMRDTIQGNVRDEGDMVIGVVWTPVDYAVYVHEGTSEMMSRPFLLDAVRDGMPMTRALLEDGLRKAMKDVSS